MKRLLAATAVAAVMMAGVAAPAFALTIAEGQQASPTDQFNLVRGAKLPASGSFTDYYTFSVSGPTFLDASYTLSGYAPPPKADQTPTSVVLSLYSGTPTGSMTFITSVSAESAHLRYNLTGTNYYLEVMGTSHGTGGGYGGTATFTSTVPLPNSVALFGVAIAGLGLAGVAHRRSAKAAV